MQRAMKQAQGTRVRYGGAKLVCPKCRDVLFLGEKFRHVMYCPTCLVPMKEK